MILEIFILITLITFTFILLVASIHTIISKEKKQRYFSFILVPLFTLMICGFDFKNKEIYNVHDLSSENLVKNYTEKQESKGRIYYSEKLINTKNGQIYKFVSNDDSIKFDNCKKIKLEQVSLDSRIFFYNIFEGKKEQLTHNNVRVICVGD